MRNRVTGFTTIELVTIIAIVGLLSFLAIPKFFSTITYNRQVYYDEVLNTIRYARKLAVGSGTHIQVALTATSITLQRRTEGGTCTSATFSPVTDPAATSSGYVKTAPSGVTLSFSGGWPIYFNGLGQALTASNCTIISSQTVSVAGVNTVTVIGETGFTQ